MSYFRVRLVNSVITVSSGQDGMFQCEGWNGGSSPTEEGWKIHITSYFREDFKNNKQVGEKRGKTSEFLLDKKAKKLSFTS